MTPAQAKRLGIDLSTGKRQARAPGASPRPRREAWAWHSRCHRCQEEFTTEAAEERHCTATHHHRYETIFERNH